jgi:hypothetical protein
MFILKKLLKINCKKTKEERYVLLLFFLFSNNLFGQNFHTTIGINFFQTQNDFNLYDTTKSVKDKSIQYQAAISGDYITKNNTIFRGLFQYGSIIYINPYAYTNNNIQIKSDIKISKNNTGLGVGIGKQYLFNSFILKNVLMFTFNKHGNDSQIARTTSFGSNPYKSNYYRTVTPYYQINLFLEITLLYKLSKNFYLGMNLNAGLDYSWGNQKLQEYRYYSDSFSTSETNITSFIRQNDFSYTILNYQLLLCYSLR